MNKKVAAFSGPLLAFGGTLAEGYLAFNILEHYVVADPGHAFFYVLLEWMVVALPAAVGLTLLLEESMNKGPQSTIQTDVDGFLRQLEGGRLKISHTDAARIVTGLNRRLKVGGQKVSMKVVDAEEQKTGIQVERSIS